jgi:hypothetical protein
MGYLHRLVLANFTGTNAVVMRALADDQIASNIGANLQRYSAPPWAAKSAL